MQQNEEQQQQANGSAKKFPVIAIAASAGGLEAFKKLVSAIPSDFKGAFIFMQHLAANYETLLSEILQRDTAIPVSDMTEDFQIAPGNIYVIPPGNLLEVSDNKIQLGKRPIDAHPLYSIDIFFTAIAEIYQTHVVGILLSGMGSDGTMGLKKIKDHGGVTIVQTPSSAKFIAMPQHAVDASVADFEMLPEEMPAHVVRIFNKLGEGEITKKSTASLSEEEANYKEILTLLRKRREVDFSSYKQSTIRRRILRRMIINKIDQLSAYIHFIDENTNELDVLYDDLLIPVTSFFRDEAIFANLCTNVFPSMFKNRNPSAPIRIWVAGCSTGEEAYSMAICLHEYLGESLNDMKVQLFATDISEKAIRKARRGMYSKRDIEGISAERLQQYFVKTDGHYHLKKNIRDLCVFAAHNFLSDPPFARMDLVSCRNVLIYMNSNLQKKAMATFHYALNENGLLLLGKSETAGTASELFKMAGKNEKLYIRKTLPGRPTRLIPERFEKHIVPRSEEKATQKSRKENFEKDADDIFLSKYTPGGVIVNEHFEIVQFRGDTSPFLTLPPGKASFNILKMAREGLSFEIRTAMHKAREGRETIVKNFVPVSKADFTVSFEVTPLLQVAEHYYLIVFRQEPLQKISNEPADSGKKRVDRQEELRIQQLEQELAQLREDMRTITEDQEAANEELQSANEELLSGSEELQSLNEELETSKEEMQSTNEELMTVNQELYDRNEQYNLSRLYAEAVVNSIREPLLVINLDLRIRSANPSFYETFSLTEEAISGKILFELQDGKWDIPELRTQLFRIQTHQVPMLEWEVDFTFSGAQEKIFLLKALPVKPDNGDQLILLAFEDITLRKKETERLESSALALKEELHIIEDFFMQAPALFCILKGPDHIFEFANPRYEQVSGGTALKGRKFAEAFPELGNEGYKDILDEVYTTGKSFSGRELKATHYPGRSHSEETYIDLSCQPYKNNEGTIQGVMFFSYEVTSLVLERKKVEANAEKLEKMVAERTAKLQETNIALEQSNKNLQGFASIASHDLQEPLRKIRTFIAMLRQSYSATLPPAADLLLVKTETASNRMSVLIKDVLNYSRIAHPGKIFTTVDLGKIAANVLDDFELVIKEKNVIISIDNKLPLVNAEPSQMNQLFYNLISNALKFSSKTAAPVIHIYSDEISGEALDEYKELKSHEKYARIVVSDNGIGFDPKYRDQIFSIFERLNSTSEYEGTGIGLALCRKIMEQHHGTIFAENNEQGGSRFIILMPLS